MELQVRKKPDKSGLEGCLSFTLWSGRAPRELTAEQSPAERTGRQGAVSGGGEDPEGRSTWPWVSGRHGQGLVSEGFVGHRESRGAWGA